MSDRHMDRTSQAVGQTESHQVIGTRGMICTTGTDDQGRKLLTAGGFDQNG